MPELPEVETARRTLDRVLAGREIAEAEIADDAIVLRGVSHDLVRQTVLGRRVKGTGRKGKTFWIEFDEGDALFGHLGMAGWIRQIGAPSIRLLEHGTAPFEDADGKPRFMKLLLTNEAGESVVMTDGRRLARVWHSHDPTIDPKVLQLGPDVWLNPWKPEELARILGKRSAPMKAVLLDQSVFAGVGNWIADEVLYQAGIAPQRAASSLDNREISALLIKLKSILDLAVEVGADMHRYPPNWLFHHRWGGKKGAASIEGIELARTEVGGRTTVWAPSLQK